METIKYILAVSACLTLLYAAYAGYFKFEKNFKRMRWYFYASIIVSVFIPLSPLAISLPQSNATEIAIVQEDNSQNINLGIATDETNAESFLEEEKKSGGWQNMVNMFEVNWQSYLKYGYWLMVAVLLLRVGFNVLALLLNILHAETKRNKKFTIVYNSKYKTHFSFFQWIFINKKEISNEEEKQIIAHEKIHAQQWHSVDILIFELLSAVMWFNPFIGKMRDHLQLVHEYLADEGALNTGIDRLQYQALLVNQVTEERLICLSSSFNHSLIKKRMTMIVNKSKQKKRISYFSMTCLIGILVVFMAFTKGSLLANVQAAVPNPPAKDQEEIKVTGYANATEGVKIRKVDSVDQKEAIYMIDGKMADNMDDVSPEDIRSIEVQKYKNTVVVNTKEKQHEAAQENPVLVKKSDTQNIVTAVSPVKMNVLYLGVDNPVRIASSGYAPEDLEVSISKGSIKGGNGEYIIYPRMIGNSILTIKANGKLIQETSFRVKKIPNPIAKIDGKAGGPVGVDFFNNNKMVRAEFENFDFDLQFEIVSFDVSSTLKGFIRVVPTKGNSITNGQYDLIQQLDMGSKVYFENIKAKGPDGKIRSLPSLAFLIIEEE